MVDLDTARILAMDTWFGNDHADQVTLNGADINAQVLEQGSDDDDNSMFDYIDIEFRLTDYPAVAYRTDTAVFNGTAWKWPRKVKADSHTRTVRFIDNQRPIHGRGGR